MGKVFWERKSKWPPTKIMVSCHLFCFPPGQKGIKEKNKQVVFLFVLKDRLNVILNTVILVCNHKEYLHINLSYWLH